MKAAVITVGDELLNGQTIDTNSAWIGQELNKIGVTLTTKIAAPDLHEDIIRALEVASEKAELILMTGGLGPTKDDITKKSIADYIGDSMIFSESTYRRIEDFFKKRNRKILQAHRDQCYIPSKAQLVQNPRGTAPGMWFEHKNKIILSMPGVPGEMKAIMNTAGLDMIKKLVKDSHIKHYIIQTAGVGETTLAEAIDDIVDSFPNEVSIAYLPNIGRVKLRITAKTKTQKDAEELSQKYGQLITERVEKYVFGIGDITLSAALGQLCKAKSIKISTAESCTGGGIGNTIVSQAGSSAYYEGTIVSYSNQLKTSLLGVSTSTLNTHGAVSKQTVTEMVAGLIKLTHTDVGLAVSGIAGPGGGTPDKPVGTIWLAVGSRENIITKKLQLARDRTMNISYTITLALNELRLFIQDNF